MFESEQKLTRIDIAIFQTNDTICTDEEATMAQQVAMQLSGGLNVYNSMKGVKQAPYVTTVEVCGYIYRWLSARLQ